MWRVAGESTFCPSTVSSTLPFEREPVFVLRDDLLLLASSLTVADDAQFAERAPRPPVLERTRVLGTRRPRRAGPSAPVGRPRRRVCAPVVSCVPGGGHGDRLDLCIGMELVDGSHRVVHDGPGGELVLLSIEPQVPPSRHEHPELVAIVVVRFRSVPYWLSGKVHEGADRMRHCGNTSPPQ